MNVSSKFRFAPFVSVALLAGFIVLIVATPLASAAEVVNGFGVGGWYSWDTRSTTGAQLVGTNDTSPAWPGTHTTADDAAIQQQIIFMGEGQTVNDAAGGTPPASPAGSLNGLGYVRLDGTNSNSGKSDISYVSTSGIAPSSALTAPSFELAYRYYIQPNPTFRTLGLNISLTNASQSNLFTFAYVDPAAVAGWNLSSVSVSSGLFSLFANGSSAESGATKTLADWANDPTYGSQIFNANEEIFRIGFNLGSSQRNNLQYLDWTQTNLLNNGDLIDFQNVPEPSIWIEVMLGAVILVVLRRQKNRAAIG